MRFLAGGTSGADAAPVRQESRWPLCTDWSSSRLYYAYGYTFAIVLHVGSKVVRRELCRITTPATRTYAFLEVEPPAASASLPSQNLFALSERVRAFFARASHLCIPSVLLFLMHFRANVVLLA